MYRGELSSFQNVFRLGGRMLRNTLRFTGRSTRTELVAYWIIAVLFQFVAMIVAAMGFRSALLAWPSIPLGWIFGLPLFAYFARRLHDIGMPGWPGPLVLVTGLALSLYRDWLVQNAQVEPLWMWPVNFVAVIVTAAIILTNPTIGPNRYGPDPRESEPEPA
jgi:uncharacterized membrane protein YhaH (DUF805 family)